MSASDRSCTDDSQCGWTFFDADGNISLLPFNDIFDEFETEPAHDPS